MRLTDEMEKDVQAVVRQIKRERKIRWLSNFERATIERGVRRGYRKGMREGKEQGLQQGIVDTICAVLSARFGSVPEEIRAALGKIPSTQKLMRLSQSAVSVDSLEAFHKLVLAESES